MNSSALSIKEKNKGILCIICAAFFFALMNLFVKLAGDVPVLQKAFFRNLVAIFFALAVLKKEHISIHTVKGNVLLVIGRSFFGTVGIFCNFYAIDHLNISDASMLNKLSPFFAILFSFFMLRERIKPYQLACVLVALCGTLFILKPQGDALLSIPALIGLCSGAAAGMAYTLLRKATGRGVKGTFIVLFFSVFSCLCSLPYCLLFYSPMKLWQFASLIGAGLAATGGQFSITAAYTHAPASELSVYDYTQIFFAGILGFLFLGEVPDLLSYLGYAIIIGASVVMFLYRNHQEHLERKEDTSKGK